MSDVYPDFEQQEQQDGPRHQQERERPPRWVLLVIVIGMFVMAYWGISNQLSADSERALATIEKQAAQGNAVNLAEEIQVRCETDKSVIVGDRDLCAKADSVSENPSLPIHGVAGKDGRNGRDGTNGVDGKPGEDSTVPGPAGPTGPPGPPGTPGTDGVDGVDGTDGTDGERGSVGATGATGATGPAPSSITITDASGRTQTCTPNPPGSTQFTCTYDDPLRTK